LRAWPLQERFLSPRIIEYGTLQTRWICQSSGLARPIDGFKNTTVYNEERSDDLFTRALPNILESSEPATTDGDRRRNLLDQWDKMLQIYTHRTLALGTDRLPAFSGIAAQFGRSLCDEYKAGLWSSAMESQLHWVRARSKQTKLSPRPFEYQGPSWSWAAINEPIYLSTRGDNHVDFEIVDCNIRIHKASERFSVYNPSFGAVESASLQVRGRLGPAKCCTFYKRELETQYDQVILRKTDDTVPEAKLEADVYLDALEVEFAERSVGAIPVFLISIAGPVPKGLILRQIEAPRFSRLGVFEFSEFYAKRSPVKEQIEWLNSCPLETITII
jgi:hypothetical protein